MKILLLLPVWIIALSLGLMAYVSYEKAGQEFSLRDQWQRGVVEKCLPPQLKRPPRWQ